MPLYSYNPEESLRAIGIEYPCPRCHEQLGGSETRQANAVAGDVVLAQSVHTSGPVREAMRLRFPAPRPTHPLVDEIIDLHTPRQLAGLQAILKCIEAEERIGAVTPALRLALLHAVLLASRLNLGHDRPVPIRIVNGVLRPPGTHNWRERNPWLAFEDGLKIVKAFVQRLDVGTPRAALARLAVELSGIESGTANIVLAEATPGALRRLGLHGERTRHSGASSRVKLMLGHTPLRWTPERLAVSYQATGWLFGAAAVSMLPYLELFETEPGPAAPSPLDDAVDMARALGRSLAIAAPALASDSRAVILLDDAEPATLIAAALGGAAAGCRLVDARLRRGGEDSNGIAVYVPPTGVVAPGPRTRANRPLPPVSGGAGDPGHVLRPRALRPAGATRRRPVPPERGAPDRDGHCRRAVEGPRRAGELRAAPGRAADGPGSMRAARQAGPPASTRGRGGAARRSRARAQLGSVDRHGQHGRYAAERRAADRGTADELTQPAGAPDRRPPGRRAGNRRTQAGPRRAAPRT